MLKILLLANILGAIIYFLRKRFLKSRDRHYQSNNKEKSTPLNQTKYRLGRIIETKTTYQSAGMEERIVDNSKNNGLVKRKLTISREWKKSIMIEKEANNHLKGKIGLPYGLIEGEISTSLAEKYGTTLEETKYFSEEVELEISAHSKVILSINWKIIWQNGEIEVLSNTSENFLIPYKIVKGITFDQIQEKIN